jgi:hypothetical protein
VVGHALHIVDHIHGRDHRPQVGGGGLLGCDEGEAFLFHHKAQVVDRRIVRNDLPGEGLILILQRRDGTINRR